VIRFDINLASPEVAKRKAVRRGANVAIGLLLLLIALDAVALRTVWEETATFDARMTRVTQDTRQMQAALRRLGRAVSPKTQEDLQKEIDAINALIERRAFSWIAFLADLEARVDDDLSIQRIQPGGGNGDVTLEGVARSLPALTAFVERLQKEGPFSEVFLNNQKRLEEGEEGAGDEEAEAIGFSIHFRYAPKERKT